MTNNQAEQVWNRFKKYYFYDSKTEFALDISRMNFEEDFLEKMGSSINKAISDMQRIEAGEFANIDENRMVGHYWLRNTALSPNKQIKEAIEESKKTIHEFARKLHSGHIKTESGDFFQHLLIIGIGGSALGPQFIEDALCSSKNKLTIHYFDNTDPDGFDKALDFIPDLSKTLGIVVSKSGGTKETANGLIVFQEALKSININSSKHLVAITGENSNLDQQAVRENWVARFPMWDWVGGRTSVLSAVGLLPASIAGHDIEKLLAGAGYMDELTRQEQINNNPAALMALMWFYAGKGKGLKDMVILPYRDRLLLLSRYLQQLIMESLGKELDLRGNKVSQGIAVYGNKGSTDQHAYVQQLRDGINNFFAIFVRAKSGSKNICGANNFSSKNIDVEKGITADDYLSGFLLGTRQALFEKERESISITIKDISEFSLGMLIALFERSVGLYASLIGVNAYHQPGVEAGKKAASDIISLQKKIINHYMSNQGQEFNIEEIAKRIEEPYRKEDIFYILSSLVSKGKLSQTTTKNPFESYYRSN